MTDNTATSNQVGAGQQTPTDSTALPNQITFAVKRILARLDTMKLVKVVAVTPGSGSPPGPTFVDVMPLVQQIDGNSNVVSHGVVHNIPVDRLQGGGWTVILDPAVDDIGYVVASDRDISKVKSTQAEAPPGSRRTFNISDGVYRGAILMKPTDAYFWLKSDGTFKLVPKGGFVLESDQSGNGIVTGNLILKGNLQLQGSIEAVDGTTYAGNIHTTGTVTGDTDVIAAGKSGANHIHVYLKPTTGATSPNNTSGPQ